MREFAQRLEGLDPRWPQIWFLTLFLGLVLATRPFTLSWAQMGAGMAGALAAQGFFLWWLGLDARRIGFLSPLISALSLCLLLRSNSLWVPFAAGALAIGSKFLVRVRGKHVFNPTNFGILVLVLLTEDAWVATSQWGQGLLLAFFLAALGGMVVGKIGRTDIVLAFLGVHLGLRLVRVLVLGHELEVFLHQSLSGALILFAFFMISDPKSTPDARAGRILFATVVACVAYVLRFWLFWNDAILWALLFTSPLAPVLDGIWRSAPFRWRREGPSHEPRTDPTKVSLPGAAHA